MNTKTSKCSICKKHKELSQFYKAVGRYNGRDSKCIDCKKEWEKQYRITRKTYWANYKKKNAFKQKAREKLRYAVKMGRVKKQKCKCGNSRVEAHHEDYSEPLEVIWFCHKCHMDFDSKKKEPRYFKGRLKR